MNDLILMKLFHFTDQPLQQYLKYIKNKVLTLPSDLNASRVISFLKTEEDEKNQLRGIFEKYNAAKLRVDGRILPNIVLHSTMALNSSYRRFGLELDSQRKTLSFITTSNMLYQVEFDKYFLKREETVFVRNIELTELNGLIKAFDVVLDQSYNQYVYVVGTSLQLN